MGLRATRSISSHPDADDKSCVCIPFGEGGYSVTPTPVAGSCAVSTVEFVRDLVGGRQACAGRQWLTDGQVRGVALPGLRVDQPAVLCSRPDASADSHVPDTE